MKYLLKKKPALGFVFVSALIDVIGFGVMFPVLPKLISELISGDISTAAKYGGWLTFAYSITQCFAAPVLGNLSDRIGRRPLLLLSLFPLLIDSFILANGYPIIWLFAGKILGGTIGGSYSIASAYVADISSQEKRSRNFGILNAAAGIGIIIGPVIGGLLAKQGIHAPCYLGIALSLINVIYTFFFVPESLSVSQRRKFEWKRSNPVGVFLHLKKLPLIRGLIIAMGLIYIAGDSLESVWSYFTIEKFNWQEEQIGYSLGLLGLSFALVQGIVCPFILPRIGDKRSVFLGLTLQCITFVLVAFAFREWMLFALAIPFALSSIFGPAIQSITANLIPDSEQGELQGGLSALRNTTSIIGPILMTGLFSLFSGKDAIFYFPGMPYIFAAILVIFSILLIKRSFSVHQKK